MDILLFAYATIIGKSVQPQDIAAHPGCKIFGSPRLQDIAAQHSQRILCYNMADIQLTNIKHRKITIEQTMLAVGSPQHNTLAFVARAVHLLTSQHSFDARVQEFFAQLQSVFDYTDARLTCWPAGIAAHSPQQYQTLHRWDEPWRDDLTLQVATGQAPISAKLNSRDYQSNDTTSLAYYGAPLFANDQLWGVLEFRAPEHSLDSNAQDIVLAVAPILAAAIAAQSRNQAALVPGPGAAIEPSANGLSNGLSLRQSASLELLCRDMEEPLSLTTLFEQLLQWALDSTGAEAGSISMVDHERQEVVLQIYSGYYSTILNNTSLAETQRRRSWNTGIAGRVARNGRAVLLRDVTQDPDYTPISADVRAEVAFPFVYEGKTLAVLMLDSPRSAAFGESELALLRAMCAAAIQPIRRAIRYQELLETSTQLGQVFSGMPTGLVLLDRRGFVLRYNPGWLTVWSIAASAMTENFQVPLDLVPLLLNRLADPIAFTEFAAAGQQNPSEIQASTLQLRNPHQELHLISVPTRDSLNQLTGRLWIVSDVTREREADRLKSEFISVVSHELRTPLTSILGYTELLLARDFAAKEQREFIKTVYDEASHLSQIVEDLLGVSRIESGNVKLNQWVVSMRQLVNEIIAQMNMHLTSRHRMVINLPQQLAPVYIDRDKVKQIFFNLLTNAVKYSPKGGEITLSVEELQQLPADHPPGHFLLVSIADQGLGIPEEEIPRVWERFYRVDNSNTRRIGGTGLGLSIVKSLVELHGGRIWLTSTLDHGSTFFFTLPIATDIMRE